MNKYNIVRIDAATEKKHVVHPGYETQDGAKTIIKEMAQAHLKQGHVIKEFELGFTTVANQDLYRVEAA